MSKSREVLRDELVTLEAEYDHLREQFEALDDAIRDALDFLPEPPLHPNGSTREAKASWFLNRALDQHGAQLLKNWGAVEAAPSGDTGLSRVQAAPQHKSEGGATVSVPFGSSDGCASNPPSDSFPTSDVSGLA